MLSLFTDIIVGKTMHQQWCLRSGNSIYIILFSSVILVFGINNIAGHLYMNIILKSGSLYTLQYLSDDILHHSN